MAKKDMVSPNRQQPPMDKNVEPNMEEEITICSRAASAA